MMAIADERRDDQRPVWVRVLSSFVGVFGPVVLPVLLLVALYAYTMAQDAEPGGVGEPSTGLVPGAVTATGWHRFDTSFVPDGFGRGDPGHDSPQALVDTMATEARRAADGAAWISGSVVSQGVDTAKVRVYLPLPEVSNATVAAEMLLELAVKSDGWYVDDADVRFHCRRAVRGGALCG
jgi:hypothetical protein